MRAPATGARTWSPGGRRRGSVNRKAEGGGGDGGGGGGGSGGGGGGGSGGGGGGGAAEGSGRSRQGRGSTKDQGGGVALLDPPPARFGAHHRAWPAEEGSVASPPSAPAGREVVDVVGHSSTATTRLYEVRFAAPPGRGCGTGASPAAGESAGAGAELAEKLERQRRRNAGTAAAGCGGDGGGGGGSGGDVFWCARAELMAAHAGVVLAYEARTGIGPGPA